LSVYLVIVNFVQLPRGPSSTLFPYTTLFRSAEDALLLGKFTSPLHCLRAGYRHYFVIKVPVDGFLQDARNEIRRPALYRMRLEGRVAGRWRAAGTALLKLAGAEELRVGWFTEHDAGIRPLPPQNATDARNGASGAVASHEIIQARASEIIHDLARRGHFVDVRICFGFKLTGKEPAIGFGQFHGLLVHAETLERTRSQD